MDMHTYTQLDVGINCYSLVFWHTQHTRRMYTHARGSSQELFAVEWYWWGCGSDGERERERLKNNAADALTVVHRQPCACLIPPQLILGLPNTGEHSFHSACMCVWQSHLCPRSSRYERPMYVERYIGRKIAFSWAWGVWNGTEMHGLRGRHQSQLDFWAAKNIVNSVEYEAQLTQKSVSNQAVFCLSTQPTLTRGEIIHLHTNLLVVLIPIEMTGFNSWKFSEQCKCDCTSRLELFSLNQTYNSLSIIEAPTNSENVRDF